MRRSAPLALLPLVLLLLLVPGASAKTCTASANGDWATSTTWSCSPAPNAAPSAADAVVVPAGKTVTLANAEVRAAARLTILGGALVLGDGSEIHAVGLTLTGGGTISGPSTATVSIALAGGDQAVIDSAGVTLTGATVVIGGLGGLTIAGPLVLRNGATFESDVPTSWTGTSPWLLGGDDGTPATSIFEMNGAQLTIGGPAAAQSAAGDGQLRLDGGATLVKTDATLSTLSLDVALDTLSEVHVNAGKLVGSFEGWGSLYVGVGATLGLDGAALQLAPPVIGLTGGTLEIEPDAGIALVLPNQPALLALAIGSGAALDVSTDDSTSASASPSPPDALAQAIAIGSAGTLRMSSGSGTLGLDDTDALSGSGTLDGSLDNSGGTVSPSGVLRLTGDYAQGAAGTLALGLRNATDGDSLRVEGKVGLAGTLRVATGYSPLPSATLLVLAAQVKPSGKFTTTDAPLGAGRAWLPAYDTDGVTLGVAGAGQDALVRLTRPSLRPALPVVGGRTRCLPGKWNGAHSFAYRWLRGSKLIAKATSAQYLVSAADSGRPLSCRVTATAIGGAHATAASKRAKARTGLQIGTPAVQEGGALLVPLRCIASERRCRGTLTVLVDGRAVAAGHFALRSPGGSARLAPVGAFGAAARRVALVRVSYRNRAGLARVLSRRFVLAG